MNFRVGLLVVLVVVGTVAGTVPVTTAEPDRTEPIADVGTFEADTETFEDVDADETRLDVSLQSDGTAEWTVSFWMRLDDDESRDAFESLRDDVDENPDAYTESFAERIETTVGTASDATDREMSADGFAVETDRQSLGPEYGIVTYSFDWQGFAAVDGDELRAGDAIEGIHLDDGTRLTIDWPDEYELVSASPEPDDQRDRVVVWYGSETDFVSGEPRVVVSTSGTGLGATAVGVGILAAAVIGAGVAWWYRRRGSPPAPSTDDSDPAGGAAERRDTRTRTDTASPADRRDDLLSNEEQVLLVLEEHDGRVKQQTVVDELEWSNAKTSKVVSELREEGKLESFRLGRENVLSLPDDGADSNGTRESVRNE